MGKETFIKLSELQSIKEKLGVKLIKQRDEDGELGIEEAVTAGQISLVNDLMVKAKKKEQKVKNTIAKEEIDSILERTQFTVEEFHGKCTVVVAKLPNGFILTESSACVDPANYDVNIGIEICKDRITNKIWELEGYLLQCEVSFKNRGGES